MIFLAEILGDETKKLDFEKLMAFLLKFDEKVC
jgi:hypothetical protein